MFVSTVGVRRVARAGLCGLLVLAWSGAPAVWSTTAIAQPAGRQPAAPRGARSDPAAVVAELKSRVGRLVAASRELNDTPLDPNDLIAKVGRDPAALTTWVREQVRFEPYHGFMKGARGAVVSHRANSADKALLLAEALQACGVKAQLVRGKLEPKSLPAAELPPAEKTPEPEPAALQAYATAAGLPVERVQALLREGQSARQGVAEDLWARFGRDFEVIAGQLQAAKVPPPVPTFSAPDEHWWVRTPAGDLDPTIDPKPAAQEAGVFELTSLPADAFHTLTLRMKIKRDDGTENTVLDAPVRSADVFGGTLVLGNMPVEGMEKLEKLGSGNQAPTPRQILDALASTTKFQPQLSTPAGPVAGAPFDLAGNVLPMSKGRFDHVADAGAGQRNAFGGLGGGIGGGGAKEEKKTRLTACWTEFVLSAPGSDAPLTVRRDLLVEAPPPAPNDKDAAAQRVLDLLAMRELLVLPEELSESFVTDATLDFASQWVDHLGEVLGALGQRPLSMKNYTGAPRLSATLLGFGSSRRAALRLLRDARFKDVTYVHARPTLVSHTRRFVTGQQPKSVAGIDILYNDLVALGQRGGDWSASFTLAAGVLDTALEHVCNSGPGPHENTSVLLDRALLAGSVPAVGAAAAKVSERAKRQMQADGPRAAHVVVPGAPAAWYRVDLDTGMSLGVVEGGGGQDTSEYVTVVDIIIQLKEVFEFYGDLFKCIGIGVTAPLGGSMDGRRDFLECAWNLICKKLPDVIASMVGMEMDNWTNIIVHQTLQKTIWEGFCQKLFDDAAGPKK